jgi:hypothetical protein
LNEEFGEGPMNHPHAMDVMLRREQLFNEISENEEDEEELDEAPF